MQVRLDVGMLRVQQRALQRRAHSALTARPVARPAGAWRILRHRLSVRRYSDGIALLSFCVPSLTSLKAAPPSGTAPPPPTSAPFTPSSQLQDLPSRSAFAPAGRNDPRFSSNSQSREAAVSAKEYNALINKNIRLEKYNTVFKLAKEMQDKNLVPTLETLNSIIRAYLASGLTHKAWKTFEEIEYHKLTPNIFTLNCLVEVHFALFFLGPQSPEHRVAQKQVLTSS